MATYEEIEDWVKKEKGFIPKSCWIAHVKEICGLPVKKAWNRYNDRLNPCPPDRVQPIKEAFKHFKMI